MPRIFDNIELELAPAIRDTLKLSYRADFCVGYFNLRGWKQVDDLVDRWEGTEDGRCRLLVGMNTSAAEELRGLLSLRSPGHGIDQQTALRLVKQMAEDFRAQLTLGAPTNDDERTLRRLARQVRNGKVRVKLFLRHPLHAKLYLMHLHHPVNPAVAILGSSNLTLAGLSKQGELNVDVLDHDACDKLQAWFNARWTDRFCVDISDDLATIIEESWAREDLVPPYHLYLKIAYHLSQEARSGLAEFRLPREFAGQLFEFQQAAVKIAAHHLLKRGGVLIGDVVGLGKTLMATALARVFQDDHFLETLVICPKNLVPMWEDYVAHYRLVAKVLPLSRVEKELPSLRRYRLMIIDESHNLRNREGKRFRAIQEYIAENESRCILLSATPYNKTHLDLSAQLRLFVPPEEDLGIRPERKLDQVGELQFIRQHQCGVSTLAAFEKSEHPDDWRELLRRYMVRRTRSFIKQHYTLHDPVKDRRYLTMSDGSRSYFPERRPHRCLFVIDEQDPQDPYARLYSASVVNAINTLSLPRYGLGNYVNGATVPAPDAQERKTIEKLSRAGRRLMGFSRTNLFKRLESGGPAFLLSLRRHALRNYVFLHALEEGLSLPLGTQEAEMLDPIGMDAEPESLLDEGLDAEGEPAGDASAIAVAEADFRERAAFLYEMYHNRYARRFTWVRPTLFTPDLRADLQNDARAILKLLQVFGSWDPARDAKLNALQELLTRTRPNEKVLVFTQFADTVHYLCDQLGERGLEDFAGVTGQSEHPTELIWRFSPESNQKRELVRTRDELRVLIATDVLSEGQNLQDAHVVVNYDLPWAIIRLIQRAGRVDRIGQKHDTIHVYSFLPAAGVERIIRLRGRVLQRLRENAEVVGTDERFFEDEAAAQPLLDLYNEKAELLEGDGIGDGEVDLSSEALQIWKNATDDDPALARAVAALPNVVLSARRHDGALGPDGVVLYLRTAEGNDALAWVDGGGQVVTQSQQRILAAAACVPDEPALPRAENHHDLVACGAEHIVKETALVGGQLGRPSGARFRVYERLRRHAESVRGTLLETPELLRAIEDIYSHPLRSSATDTLNRQLKAGIGDQQLADLVVGLRNDDRLTLAEEEAERREPQIICSLGLVADPAE